MRLPQIIDQMVLDVLGNGRAISGIYVKKVRIKDPHQGIRPDLNPLFRHV